MFFFFVQMFDLCFGVVEFCGECVEFFDVHCVLLYVVVVLEVFDFCYDCFYVEGEFVVLFCELVFDFFVFGC